MTLTEPRKWVSPNDFLPPLMSPPPEDGFHLRGQWVGWRRPGDSVEGIVAYINLTRGAFDMNGDPIGLLQIWDPADGEFRRIHLANGSLMHEMEKLLVFGMRVGWWVRAVFAAERASPSVYARKVFQGFCSEPSIGAQEAKQLATDGLRPAREGETARRRR